MLLVNEGLEIPYQKRQTTPTEKIFHNHDRLIKSLSLMLHYGIRKNKKIKTQLTHLRGCHLPRHCNVVCVANDSLVIVVLSLAFLCLYSPFIVGGFELRT